MYKSRTIKKIYSFTSPLLIFLVTFLSLGGAFLFPKSTFADTTVGGCQSLATPNETYEITGDFGGGGDCLIITASGITINGGGHTITGNINASGVLRGDGDDGLAVQITNLTLNGDIIASGADGIATRAGSAGSVSISNTTVNGNIVATGGTGSSAPNATSGDGASGDYGGNGGNVTLANHSKVTGTVSTYGGAGGNGGMGANGSDATSADGVAGSDGAPGTDCDPNTNCNGGDGSPGQDGTSGSPAGDGGAGGNGGNGGAGGNSGNINLDEGSTIGGQNLTGGYAGAPGAGGQGGAGGSANGGPGGQGGRGGVHGCDYSDPENVVCGIDGAQGATGQNGSSGTPGNPGSTGGTGSSGSYGTDGTFYQPTDMSAPSATISSPTNGSGVNGSSVYLSADVTDNGIIAGVQFRVSTDGSNFSDLGSEITSEPYDLNWDSTTVSNGVYYIDVVARDVAGNSSVSDAISVNVSNTIYGCTTGSANNYNSGATQDDGSCTYDTYGCTDNSANNYNSSATISDGSCTYDTYGCMDSGACNYNSSANINSGCDYSCQNNTTCTDGTACNYGSSGSCDYSCHNVNGCTDSNAYNYNSSATNDDGSCVAKSFGCTNGSANNYNASANTDDGSCTYTVNGCMNGSANNYNSSANTDDGSCLFYGCTDTTANNYNSGANYNDGSCAYTVPGCTNSSANNYNPSANSDDGSCLFYGCTTQGANNYNSSANYDDGSCDFNISGCTDNQANNYNISANVDSGGCTYNEGCMDSSASNYDSNATHDNGSCTYNVSGCTDPSANNYNSSANTDDGSCTYTVTGCTDNMANNYNSSANSDDGSCTYTVSGCTDGNAINYNSSANNDDGSCYRVQINNPLEGDTIMSTWGGGATVNWGVYVSGGPGVCEYSYDNTSWYTSNCGSNGSDFVEPQIGSNTLYIRASNNYFAQVNFSYSPVYGCTDSAATNYDPSATVDDASCSYDVVGCTDSNACNYDPSANVDSGCDYSCQGTSGCTDTTANNYNSSANSDDGSCTYDVLGCTDPSAFNYNSAANVDDGSCVAVVLGCMDSSANNYDSSANTDDGSCTYDVSGCTDGRALNYNGAANIDDGSCYFVNITQPVTDYALTSATWAGAIVDWGIYGPTECAYSYDNSSWIATDCSLGGSDIGAPDTTGNITLYIRSTDQSFAGAFNKTSASVNFTYDISGCTDSSASNYDSTATVDDGSCTYDVLGCTDSAYLNYNSSATVDDGSCSNDVLGCTDPVSTSYDPAATIDDGSCLYNMGCTDSTAFNYDALANRDDGSCVAVAFGCIDGTANNYNSSANTDDGSCTYDVVGLYFNGAVDNDWNNLGNWWGDASFVIPATVLPNNSSTVYISAAVNSNSGATPTVNQATFSNGAVIRVSIIATNSVIFNDDSQNLGSVTASVVEFNNSAQNHGDINGNVNVYYPTPNPIGGTVSGNVDYLGYILGCTDSTANNYNNMANTNDASCTYDISGCTDSSYVEYNAAATIDNATCLTLKVFGCTDSSANNYDSSANTDDASCEFVVSGCTDSFANNYNPSATTDDGSCTYDVYGCTDPVAINYNSSANIDDGFCVYMDITAPTHNQNIVNWTGATVNWGNFSPDTCEYSYDNNTWHSANCAVNGSDIPQPDSNGAVTIYLRSSSPDFESGTPQTTQQTFNYIPPDILGCTDSGYTEYNSAATVDDGSCSTLVILGCMNEAYLEYSGAANTDDGSCVTPKVPGCTDPSARNYNSSANVDDSSCTYDVLGCTDAGYEEYDPSANVDDGSCVTLIGNGNGVSVPQISGLSATPASNAATISWTTNVDASSQVSFGPTYNYSRTTAETDVVTRVTSHSINISGLVACSIYHYKVASTDELSHTGESNDSTFTTTGCTGNAAVVASDSNSINVGSGGSFSVDSMNISVPNNFTSATTSATFQIKKLNTLSFVGSAGTPSGQNFVGTVYNLKALVNDTDVISTFDHPITVTLSYSPSDIININPSTLSIYRYDGSAWYPLSSCSVNTGARTVTCETSNFSDFAIFGTAYTPIISTGGGGGGVFNFLTMQANNSQSVAVATTAAATTTTPAKTLLNLKASRFTFTKVLQFGDTNTEVLALQRFLNATGYTIAKTGAGSKGKETNKFGAATKAALAKFQKSHRINPPAGYFGLVTRSYINAMLKASQK
ncbi:MAG: hypothetical protein JWP09_594 [Candidatus Taylorbacteria bacterium]|nr:hypothetical protein [Candidatus Taylorbacteria bacterium]